MGSRGENIRMRPDGRWEARVALGVSEDGRTRVKCLYGKTYKEARLKKSAYLNSPQIVSDKTPVMKYPKPDPDPDMLSCVTITFQEAAYGWLVSKKPFVKETSYAYYSTMVEKHLLPKLGGMLIGQIDYHVLADFLAEKRQHGNLRDHGPMKDKTVSDIKMLVMQVLYYAKAEHMISEVPECPIISTKQPAISVLTKQEQEQLERTILANVTSFGLGIMTSLYGGLRIGEVCGLKWGDFDFFNHTISVKRTISRITDVDGESGARTKLVIGPPKTETSRRTIPIPEPVFAFLEQYRKKDGCYVATGTTKFMEPRVCLQRFKSLQRKAKIPDHTFHCLRHTYATRCIENDIDYKTLSELMGHSDVKITMQRYVHPSMDSKKSQINKLPTFAVEEG